MPDSSTSLVTLVIARSNPATCVPPSGVGMVLTKLVSTGSKPFTQRIATSTVQVRSTTVILPSRGTFSS